MRLFTAPTFIWFQTNQPLVSTTTPPVSDLNKSIKITVYPQWYKQVSLTWEIPESWAGAKFHVYFTSDASSSYTRLTQTPTSNPFFSDTTTREYSKTSEGYYVVEAYLPFTTQVVRSLPTSWEYQRRDRVEKIANEIQRREYLLLSKFAGAKSYFFKKKTYGPRCSRCWSDIEEKIMDDNCEVCYGTSFEGGYYDPIPVFIQWSPTVANKIRTYSGTVEPSQLEGWTISFPQMNSEDVVIRTGTWSTYKILGSNPTELQTKPVRQVLTLAQLGKKDIENKLADRIQQSQAIEYLNHFESKFAKQRFPTTLVDQSKENDHKWAQEQNLSQLPRYKV